MAREQLARYPLFGILSRQQLDDWLAAGQETAYAAGETIFQENSPGAWVYLVRDGRVRILRRSGPRRSPSGLCSREMSLASTPWCVRAAIPRPAALLPARGCCAFRWRRSRVHSTA